jgi:orotate phosphoribosyltransferase
MGGEEVEKTKQRFVELLLECGVLTFGDFATKSGRRSPYFFNTGHFDSADRLGKVADLYAEGIQEYFGDKVSNLYGPAYKGIPLAVLTADRLAKHYTRDVSFTFNRKEAKNHGEGGTFVGRQYRGGERVVVVEDVLTGGTSLRETHELLKKLEIEIIGVFVGIDRQERGTGVRTARSEIEEIYQAPVQSLVNMDEVVKILHNRKVLGRVWIDDNKRAEIDRYRQEFGGRP